MKLLSMVLALSLGSSLVACKKKQDDAATASGSATTTTTTTTTTTKFNGTLTTALIMDSAHKIDVYTPDGKPATFAAALAQAKATLGEPTHVDGTKNVWGIVEGDKCTYYTLEDKGGTASSPGSMSVASNDADCLAAIGKAPAAGSGDTGSAAAGSGATGSAAAGSDATGSGSAH